MDINEITYIINGAVFEVNKELGHGFLEKVYENALLIELRKRGLSAEKQIPIKVLYKGESVGEYTADILVEGRVILELKTVDKLDKIHGSATHELPQSNRDNGRAARQLQTSES